MATNLFDWLSSLSRSIQLSPGRNKKPNNWRFCFANQKQRAAYHTIGEPHCNLFLPTSNNRRSRRGSHSRDVWRVPGNSWIAAL